MSGHPFRARHTEAGAPSIGSDRETGRVLEHFGLGGFFGGVYGPDLSSRDYSKGSLIRAALEATGFAPQSVAMVGDRGEDVIGARAAGIHAIAVTWGYGAEAELAAARPDRMVRSTIELLDYLERAA